MPVSNDRLQPQLPPELPVRERTLGFLLREVYAQLQERVYEAAAAAGHAGLRSMHSPVLRHLPLEGGRVADLARASGLAKQSVAYVVQDLSELGYLRAEPDPDDARARRLVYTARGRKLLATLVEASRSAEADLAASIGPARLAALRDTLERALQGPGTGQPRETTPWMAAVPGAAAPPPSAARRRSPARGR